jgi:protein phosphatase
LVAALVTEEGFHYISVGDSHVYLFRKGVLSQLNVDHNYLSELLHRVRRGEITREEALSDPERAHLTSYLGLRKLTLVDRSSGPIQIDDGDRILLASDGLFKVLTPSDISRQIAEYDDETAARLIGEVLKFNYRNQDNMSVALIALDEAKG